MTGCSWFLFSGTNMRVFLTVNLANEKDELRTATDGLLRAELKADMAALRNKLLTAQVAAFVGIILYITFRL